MRKEVRRAIVHQIHHLATAAKRLRSKKGTDEQKLKNASKADNMVSEIIVLKKLNPDEISMFGLTNSEESEIKNFICKQIIAPETKVMAKLCLRKNLRSAIDKFISSHSEEIDILNKLLEERYSHKKKKEIKNNKLKDNDIIEQTSDSDESVEHDSDIVNENLNLLSSSRRKSIEKMDIDSDNMSHLNIIGTSSMKPAQMKTNNFKNSSLVGKNKSTPKKKLYESDSEKNLEEQHSDSHYTDVGSSSSFKNQPSERKHVDPFFKNRDESEYRTYCNVDHSEKDENIEEKNNISKSFQNNSQKGFPNRKERRKNALSSGHQKFDNNKTITYLGGKKEKTVGKKEWKNGKKNPSNDKSSTNVKLHPSWEAKKKLAIATAPFEGKKIIFE